MSKQTSVSTAAASETAQQTTASAWETSDLSENAESTSRAPAESSSWHSLRGGQDDGQQESNLRDEQSLECQDSQADQEQWNDGEDFFADEQWQQFRKQFLQLPTTYLRQIKQVNKL